MSTPQITRDTGKNGQQSSGTVKSFSAPRIQSHAHAAQVLSDDAYCAYVMAQTAKLTIALLAKRWPEVK